MHCLLSSGHIEDGLQIARDLLTEVKGSWPATDAGTIAALLWNRAALHLRGLHFETRAEQAIPRDELWAYDVYEYLSALMPVDTMRGGLFQMLSLRKALDLGERDRIIRSLGREAVMLSSEGTANYKRAWALSEQVQRLAQEANTPALLAISASTAGTICYCAGKFAEGARFSEEAELQFRKSPPGPAQNNIARDVWLGNQLVMGRFAQVAPLVPGYLRDAIHRNDRYTEITLSRTCNILWLVQDDPIEAKERLSRSAWVPPGKGYHLQHWYEHYARALIGLYTEEGISEALEAGFKAYLRSLLTRFESARAFALRAQGNLLLIDLQQGRRQATLKDVEQIAQQLHQIPAGYTRTWGTLLEASLASLRREKSKALRLYESAAHAAKESHLKMEEAGAQLRQGELLSGEPGARLCIAAKATMQEEGVKSPERFVRLYAPVSS